MITKTLILGGTVLIAMGLFSGCGHRLHKSGDPEKKANYIVKRMTKTLKLSEVQSTEVRKIVNDLMSKGQDLMGDKQKHHAVLLKQLRSDQIDMDLISNLADEKTGQIDEMKSLMITKFSELHAILTPEQRTKLADLIEKKTARRHCRH